MINKTKSNLFNKAVKLCLALFIVTAKSNSFDLTVIGSLSFSGSIARIPILMMDILYKDLKINFGNTLEYSLKEVPEHIKNIVLNNDGAIPGNVILYTDILWCKSQAVCKNLPDGKIKIAYSMLESTGIPSAWVKVLNNDFDAVAVPDDFLVEVYKNSGVRIPIFVLPLCIYIEDFLKLPEKKAANKRFVFGCSAVNWKRKNLVLLVNAFAKAFKNTKDVFLKIHTKSVRNDLNLNKIVKQTKNVELIITNLDWNSYIKLISSLDCYVLISKGEGFSITPRDALACGIPCIITNNTAHKVICDTGFVYPVKSDIQEAAYYEVFGQVCGKQFNCSVDDVVKALHDVYKNYSTYLKKAQKGRAWVKQYLPGNLKNKYLSLIKPKKVILGAVNQVHDDYLITNSRKLYEKYMSII